MREIRKTCRNCEKPLPKGRWIYCSDYCSKHWIYINRSDYKKNMKYKPEYCLNCGKRIYNIPEKEKFCSIICNRSYKNRIRAIERNQSYLKFIIEYCKNNTYFSTKLLTYYYMKKYNIPVDLKRPHNQIKIKISRTFSGYLKTFARYHVIIQVRKNGKGKVYTKTEDFLELVEDYLNLKPLYKCRTNRTTESALLKIEWRTLREMEKNEIIIFNERICAKMHFLGIQEKIDPHFRELIGDIIVPQKLKRAYKDWNYILSEEK